MALNARTNMDRYTVRTFHDYSNQLPVCTIFSTIDLVQTYIIMVNLDDVQKTAINTRLELFEFPSMSFGLRNAAQTFQSFLDEILMGVRLLLRLHR
jgi:hypothetical protein